MAIAALFFFSCSSGNSKQSSGADSASVALLRAYDRSLPRGKVTDSIMCKNQNNKNYALYLPSYYNPGKKFPCIYFFDAHARGSLPLRIYNNLAEKYGFVLVGSNVSKNGTPWPVTNECVKALFEDTRSRINIDPQRVYTSGFSGGSRVAGSVAIMMGGVAGVIGCAAGFPRVENTFQNKFDFFGLVGDYDFNEVEMEQLDGVLDQHGFSHQLLVSDGMHGWAAPSEFETALLWMQVCAMKRNIQQRNDTLISILSDDYDRRIKASVGAGEWIKAGEMLKGMFKTLDGLLDVSTFKKQLSDMEANPAYKKAIAIRQQLQPVEMKEQEELASQFAVQNEGWWKQKISELNRNTKTASSKEESLMNRRLLNYLGLVGYMNANHAIRTGDLENASVYLKVFKMADPENPDCSYLSALYFIRKGNTTGAIASLKEAADLGYSDISQMANEPEFKGLQNDPAFKSVMGTVKEYYSSKLYYQFRHNAVLK